MGLLLPAPLCTNDSVWTQRLKKRGQVSVQIDPPSFMVLLSGRRMNRFGAAGVLVRTHSSST